MLSSKINRPLAGRNGDSPNRTLLPRRHPSTISSRRSSKRSILAASAHQRAWSHSARRTSGPVNHTSDRMRTTSVLQGKHGQRRLVRSLHRPATSRLHRLKAYVSTARQNIGNHLLDMLPASVRATNQTQVGQRNSHASLVPGSVLASAAVAPPSVPPLMAKLLAVAPPCMFLFLQLSP